MNILNQKNNKVTQILIYINVFLFLKSLTTTNKHKIKFLINFLGQFFKQNKIWVI